MNKYQLVLRISSIFLFIYLSLSFWSFSVGDGWGFGVEIIENKGGFLGAFLSNITLSLLGIGAFSLPFALLFYSLKEISIRIILFSIGSSVYVQLFNLKLKFIGLDVNGGL